MKVVTWGDERTLSEGDLDADPLRQFRGWLAEAAAAGEPMPNAMAVATTGADGAPSVRMILLEEVDSRGFVFQTNLDSPKAHDIDAMPKTALTFFWPSLLRQVRVTGAVEPLSREEVGLFWAATPAGIQTMLRACHQGDVIADRAEMERAYAAVLSEPASGPPPYWGGYRVLVETIEFWQGRQNWLQDRLRYTRLADGWKIERLVP